MSTEPLNVLKDPHSSGTAGDIDTQTKLVTALRDQMDTLAATVNQIESIRAQLANLDKQIGADEASSAVRKAATELADKLTNVEGKLIQLKSTGIGQDDVRWAPMLLSKISYLATQVSSSDFSPTTQQVALGEELKQQGEVISRQARQLIESDVAAFNSMLREHNVSNIILKTP